MNGKREKYYVPIIHLANNFKYLLLMLKEISIIIIAIIVYSLRKVLNMWPNSDACSAGVGLQLAPSMHHNSVGETTSKLACQAVKVL